METQVLTAAERDARYTAEHRRRRAAALQARIDAIVAGLRADTPVHTPDYAERAAHDRWDD